MATFAFATPLGTLGGAELFLLEMIEELRARNPQSKFHLIAGADGPLLELASRQQVDCHLLPLPAAWSRLGDSAAHQRSFLEWRRWIRLGTGALTGLPHGCQYVQRLNRLLNTLRPTFLHSNGLKFHILSAHCTLPSTRLIWFMHDYLGSRVLAKRLLPRLSSSVSLVLANSYSVARDTEFFLKQSTVQVVHCGVNSEMFYPGRVDGHFLDEAAGLDPAPERVVRIGLVATYARWKGQDLFLESAAKILATGGASKIRFYIIGGAIYKSVGSQFSELELRNQSEKLGITNSVGFVRFQQDVGRVYRALDIVVHASRDPEPFGRTILEAMACGRPVVSSWTGGAGELFFEDSSACFEANDVNSLATAISDLVGDPARREQLGMNAALRSAQFSQTYMGDRLNGFYWSLIGDS